MSMADAELLGRWMRARDPEAFRTLVTRHASMVYATCRRVLGNATEAEDVAQECFETLAFVAHAPDGHLGAWLHRVATNRALDRIKTERHRHERDTRYAAKGPDTASFSWDDVYPLVDEAITALPEEMRVPLVSAYLEGQSHHAIAKTLGIPRRTVTYRIARGIHTLRDDLARRGVPVGVVAFVAMLASNMAEAAPPTLVAQLGRIAVSGAGAPTGSTASATVTALTVGGLVMSKKAAICGGVPWLIAWVVFAVFFLKPWLEQSAPIRPTGPTGLQCPTITAPAAHPPDGPPPE